MPTEIIVSKNEEREIIDQEIRNFNYQFTGFNKDNYQQLISFCIKDDENQVIAGINGEIYFPSLRLKPPTLVGRAGL
jgi:hypothetical protein